MKQIFNTISKVYLIMESIKESKYKYLAIIDPISNEKIMKLKVNLEDGMMVDFLDTFFDKGFKIEKIDKKEFDSLQTEEVLKFKI
jgi:hypothetical protein